MEQSIRYVVFRVAVTHEKNANVLEICKVAQVFADDLEGQIDQSQVVGVYENEPRVSV